MLFTTSGRLFMRLFPETRTNGSGIRNLTRLMTQRTGRFLHRVSGFSQLTRIRRRRLPTLTRNNNLGRRLRHLESNRRMTTSIKINSNSQTTLNGLTLRNKCRTTPTTRRVTGTRRFVVFTTLTDHLRRRRFNRSLANPRSINKISHLINKSRSGILSLMTLNRNSRILNTRGIINGNLQNIKFRRQRILINNNIRRRLKPGLPRTIL